MTQELIQIKKIAIGLEKSDKEKTGVRGMDALVVQIAKEFKAPLVSLDREMTKRAKLVVKIVDIEDMVIL